MNFTCKYCGMLNDVSKRSNNQNAYLHLIFNKIADHTGYTLDEVKCLMKIEFGHFTESANKRTGETFLIYHETSKMDKKTFTEFTENVLLFANSKLNLNILSPEEYFGKENGDKTK